MWMFAFSCCPNHYINQISALLRIIHVITIELPHKICLSFLKEQAWCFCDRVMRSIFGNVSTSYPLRIEEAIYFDAIFVDVHCVLAAIVAGLLRLNTVVADAVISLRLHQLVRPSVCAHQMREPSSNHHGSAIRCGYLVALSSQCGCEAFSALYGPLSGWLARPVLLASGKNALVPLKRPTRL